MTGLIVIVSRVVNWEQQFTGARYIFYLYLYLLC